jgi:uncharacterized protein (DUF2237 family)
MKDDISLNVFGEKLVTCSNDPLTGFYRTGCCETGPQDSGRHLVCAVMTNEFLEFSKLQGNDLTTPIPQYNFPGLKEGDRWCLCALRWKEAYEAGMAPKVVLEATNEKVLNVIEMDDLLKYAYKNSIT